MRLSYLQGIGFDQMLKEKPYKSLADEKIYIKFGDRCFTTETGGLAESSSCPGDLFPAAHIKITLDWE